MLSWEVQQECEFLRQKILCSKFARESFAERLSAPDQEEKTKRFRWRHKCIPTCSRIDELKPSAHSAGQSELQKNATGIQVQYKALERIC